MADEEKQAGADVIEADTEDVSAGDSARSDEAARELEELIADIKKIVWRRKLLKALGIIAAVAGVVGPIWNYVSHNAYKTEIKRLMENECVPCYTAFVQTLSDREVGRDSETALAEFHASLDNIAAVDIPDKRVESKIDALTEEQKQFTSDMYRCCVILYSGKQITYEEKERVENFTAGLREGNKLTEFRREMGALL